MREPDPLLTRTTGLLATIPPPQFPAATADNAFPPEEVVGTLTEVAKRAFRTVEDWGYRPIGRFEDRESDVEGLAYSSGFATVWIVFFSRCLTVVVTPRAERDPSRLNHHLAEGRAGQIAAWGAFPVEARHVPAAARAFLRTGEDLLQHGPPNFNVLAAALTAAASSFARSVWRRENWATAQTLARAGRHRAVVRILEFWESELAPDERKVLEAERQAAKSEAPLLERGPKSDREWFTARAQLITAMDAALKKVDRARYAATDFHDALDLLYEDLELAISRSKRGDREAAQYLVAFLEADPWCFRSGYTKGKLHETLRQLELGDDLRQRLRVVLVRLVDVGYRREFRSACRLARKLVDADLISDLRSRLSPSSNDRHICRRALWMLDYLPHGLDEQNAAVLDVVLDTAEDADWGRVSQWVQPLCRRFTDHEFALRIKGMALSVNDDEARPGLRLLWSAIREPLDLAERSALEPRILEAVHERGPAAGLMGGLATVADTRRLRARLGELAQYADTPVNRYARWALNAAVRANGDKVPDL